LSQFAPTFNKLPEARRQVPESRRQFSSDTFQEIPGLIIFTEIFSCTTVKVPFGSQNCDGLAVKALGLAHRSALDKLLRGGITPGRAVASKPLLR
jgi:hypothetical protein